MSLIPASQPVGVSDWLSQDDVGGRQGVGGAEHAPLSPQGSVASSGSEQTEEQTNTRNTFQEDGSGMKGLRAVGYISFYYKSLNGVCIIEC